MASAAFYCRRSAFWRFSMTEASNRLHKTRVPSQPPYSLYIHKQLLRWDAFSYLFLLSMSTIWDTEIACFCKFQKHVQHLQPWQDALPLWAHWHLQSWGTAADSAISARFETWRQWRPMIIEWSFFQRGLQVNRMSLYRQFVTALLVKYL